MANTEQVSLLCDSVERWNEWRSENRNVSIDLREAQLSGVNLKYADLKGANLEGADLSYAHLDLAQLDGANLVRANLQTAHLYSTNLWSANLQGANLRTVRAEGAHMMDANLQDADLTHAFLKSAALDAADLRHANLTSAFAFGVSFYNANLTGAILTDTKLTDAMLRRAKGMKLDDTYIRNARFDTRPSDSWSILRRNYSGPMFAFHLLLLIVFIGSYGTRAFLWIGVNRVQQQMVHVQQLLVAHSAEIDNELQVSKDAVLEYLHSMILRRELDEAPAEIIRAVTEQAFETVKLQIKSSILGASVRRLGNAKPCLSQDCEQWHVWQLLLGLDRGWMHFALTILFLVYYLLRGMLTWRVSLLRDAEERSGYAPALVSYWWLYKAHYIVLVLMIVAVVAVLLHAWEFLWNTEVWLPHVTG